MRALRRTVARPRRAEQGCIGAGSQSARGSREPAWKGLAALALGYSLLECSDVGLELTGYGLTLSGELLPHALALGVVLLANALEFSVLLLAESLERLLLLA